MKLTSVTSIALSIPFYACSLWLSKSSLAQSSKYFCSTFNGNPSTMMRTVYGDVPIIIWTSRRFLAGQSHLQRCETAARGFQRAFERNATIYRAGKVGDGQSVICAVNEDNDPCSHANTIIALNRETDPNDAIAKLLRSRYLASLRPVHQNNRLLYSRSGFYHSNISTLEEAIICSEFPSASECSNTDENM